MFGGPRCPLCSSFSYWSADFSAEDFGYECEGIVGCYTCSNKECGTHIEVRDLYLDKDIEERSFKYYTLDYENEDNCSGNPDINIEVDHCIYCGKSMDIIESKPYKAHSLDGEGALIRKICSHCDTMYEIEDIYPIEDIYKYPDDYLTVYDLRTIIVK